MADSSFGSSSAASVSTGGAPGMTSDQMQSLMREFRAVYEAKLRRLDESGSGEDTQKVEWFSVSSHFCLPERCWACSDMHLTA